jgi:transglutaminase-like putative cysteine protease
MIFRITHITRYTYQAPVSVSYNEARLLPRSDRTQEVLSRTLQISPEPASLTHREDAFGNQISFFDIHRSHKVLEVTCISDIRRAAVLPNLDQTPGRPWEAVVDLLRTSNPTYFDVKQYLLASPLIGPSAALRAYAEPSFVPGRPLLLAARDLMQRIYTDFTFSPAYTTVSTPIAEVMEHRKGVCQDFAQVGIGCLRAMGVAARYMSGYIETLPPPGQERLVGADASHAWFSVFDPDLGWIDFDPTNNQLPLNQHVTVAWGRDYSDVPPLKGVIYGGGGGQKLKVSVDVARQEAQGAG